MTQQEKDYFKKNKAALKRQGLEFDEKNERVVVIEKRPQAGKKKKK